jgi:acyl-CoA reductase-like NAD-dependent aldehyde dehydrogenase
MDCMQEEIFGPILPIVTVSSAEAAIDFVLSKPKPLGAYLFSSSWKVQRAFQSKVSSGGMCINDATVHVLGTDIPFGGVGPAGMGSYHGREGFNCFSHCKSVYSHDTMTDGLTWFRYLPFTGFTETVMGLVMGKSW